MASVTVEVYSEKAIVVRNTMEHHGAIMTELGGTFNEKLKGGRGWIFSKFKFNTVKSIVDKLNSGQYGNEYEQKTSASVATVASASPNEKPVETVSKAEYLSLLSRVERLEAIVAQGRATTSTYTPVSNAPKPISKPLHKEPSSDDDMDEVEEEPVEKKRLVPLRKK